MSLVRLTDAAKLSTVSCRYVSAPLLRTGFQIRLTIWLMHSCYARDMIKLVWEKRTHVSCNIAFEFPAVYQMTTGYIELSLLCVQRCLRHSVFWIIFPGGNFFCLGLLSIKMER